MRAYKHVSAEFAKAFQSGSIKLGTLSHYRNMEGERADGLEGKVDNRVSFYTTGGPAHVAEDLARLRAFSPDLLASGVVIFDGLVETSLTDGLIFCASLEPDERLIAEGQHVFEITDFRRCGQLLNAAIPVPIGEGRFSKVSYEPRAVDLVKSRAISPHPFVKDPKFAWEREVRHWWPLLGGLSGGRDWVIVKCPAASKLIIPRNQGRAANDH